MANEKKFITCDGNYAASNLAYLFSEHAAMLKAMEAIKETNKSVFIRSAVRNFITALKKKGAI